MATGVASPLSLYARIVVMLDVLLPFFPLTAFSGMRMRQASRAGWALMAVGAIALVGRSATRYSTRTKV